MDLKLIVFFLLVGMAYSSPTIIITNGETSENGDNDLGMGNTGRALLQQKATCPINFEQQNFTIITSQCKGPNYNKTSCCEGFKQFACPFVDEINDLKTTCADSLFSYINLFGKYPPGLFANMCSGKEGVDCEGVVAPPKPQTATGLKNTPILLMIVASLVVSMSRMMF